MVMRFDSVRVIMHGKRKVGTCPAADASRSKALARYMNPDFGIETFADHPPISAAHIAECLTPTHAHDGDSGSSCNSC